MAYELWDFIQVRLMGMWLIMWSVEIEWCIILLHMNVKKAENFIYAKNEWMIERLSKVLMSHFKIHGLTGIGFGA